MAMPHPISASTGTAVNQPGCAGRKWLPAAVMIASGSSIKQTSEALSLSYQQVARWRRHPKFKEYVDSVHDGAVDAAVGVLTHALSKAATTLEQLLDDDDKRLRLEACDRIERWVRSFLIDRKALAQLEEVRKLAAGQGVVANG